MTEPPLHYGPIRPQALGLNRFLFRLRGDSEFRKRFLEDPKAAVAGIDLSDVERAVILARDVAGLVGAGAHPLLAILVKIYADLDERPEMYEYY
jgi:Aromatic-ring-opening dioxygenase LigAB, LigA subunit